ncbi:MAG: LacI family DNA-binding transcriptional regulator [Janthinobacterium lividum]
MAEQSGLSLATVDRVLNERPGVRASTVAEVQQAIVDLDRQRDQVRLAGRTFVVDLVMRAPKRFTAEVRAALEAELPLLAPAVVRSRFRLREEGPVGEVVATLDDLVRRGSHGVLLKAPDHPDVVDAVDRLVARGVPVVTLATDLPLSRRLAYVGIDNRAAGATAAYLLTRMSAGSTAPVLVTLSSTSFRGEEEREAGFRSAMRTMAPARTLREVSETDGLDASMLRAVGEVLDAEPELDTVYSIGGGNTAVLEAFGARGRTPRVFVGHDLDTDNLTLLRRHQITAVLHHDLRADARQACRLLLQWHGAIPGRASSAPSAIQVVTPYNV